MIQSKTNGLRLGPIRNSQIFDFFLFKLLIHISFQIASLNVARRHICAAAIGDQLWAFGGVIGPAQRDDTVEVYNVTSDKWLVKKKLPVTGEFDCVTLPTSLADNLK